MIRVDRSAVREPRALKRVREAGLSHARRFFVDTPEASRRQRRYFNPHWKRAYRVPIPALGELFRHKCAFCESKVNLDLPGILDHYRPKWATRGLGNEYAPNHYWWLAFAWDNLYLTCPRCNKNRGPRFPVKGARVNSSKEDLDSEEPLLLDPCRDDPATHLRFEGSGRVRPLSQKGDVTIDLVALNRSDLVAGRRRVIQAVTNIWRLVSSAKTHVPKSVVAQLTALLSEDAEFSACARQANASHLRRANASTVAALRAHGVEVTTADDTKRIIQSTASHRAPRFIDEIRLENFRGIGKLALRTPSADHTSQDWLMLIGENAAGKSSILQAIALNLMSEGDRRRLNLRPAPFVRKGARRALVEIRFRSDEPPRLLTVSRTHGFRASDQSAGPPLMAYGATRLPPAAGMPPRSQPLENLFNPFAPLLDPGAWLTKLARGTSKQREDFDHAASALAALLPGRHKQWRFKVVRGEVVVEPSGPLRQLSDGYQSVIALACDMMATLQQRFRGGMEAAEGIVLVDELGAHLHPQWKMLLTKVLRRAFPRLQCIATTHDPLCLRGLRNGEVVAIEKTPRGRVFARTDLPPIEGMRVDQILTSEYFGLRSSIDPAIEALFERMYRLKAKPLETLTQKQRTELGALEGTLAPHAVYGSSRAERLMLGEINRFLAHERGQPDKRRRDSHWAAAQKAIAVKIHKELGIAL